MLSASGEVSLSFFRATCDPLVWKVCRCKQHFSWATHETGVFQDRECSGDVNNSPAWGSLTQEARSRDFTYFLFRSRVQLLKIMRASFLRNCWGDYYKVYVLHHLQAAFSRCSVSASQYVARQGLKIKMCPNAVANWSKGCKCHRDSAFQKAACGLTTSCCRCNPE